MAPLTGKIAFVTGASRGVGRGIALQLGQAGATVYITGRAPSQSFAASHSDYSHLPSLEQTKRDIQSRGGKAVALYCDHSKPAEVEKLFEKIASETQGRLDILVNNAFSAIAEIQNGGGRAFYEMDPSLWDAVNNVGLRNHYYCAVYACRMMTKRKSGLVVNISSIGGLTYLMNVPYGCGNAALDKMATDMAAELKGTGVSIVSLWPSGVKTETSQLAVAQTLEVCQTPTDMHAAALANGESTEFAGKCIVAIASDPKVNSKSGRVLLPSDVAREYAFKDIDGKMPMDSRSLHNVLQFLGWTKLAAWIPEAIRIPLPLLHYAGYKF